MFGLVNGDLRRLLFSDNCYTSPWLYLFLASVLGSWIKFVLKEWFACTDICANQAVIEAGIVLPLVQLLQHAEFDIKKEAAWAMSNATSGGNPEQIRYVFLYRAWFMSVTRTVLYLADVSVILMSSI